MDGGRYQEPGNAGNIYRMDYLRDLSALIDTMQKASPDKRDAYMRDLHKNPERYRRDLRTRLGWPLSLPDSPPLLSVQLTHVADDDLCGIYRVQLEILPGLRMYGLWLKHHTPGPLPAVLFQHGGQGTPEVCAGFLDSGNYHDAVRRIQKRGVHVFAPQTLLWRQDEFGDIPYDRRAIDQQLKQLGSSIAAIELHGLEKCVDFMQAQPEADAGRIGIAGLSYGGYYALYAGALDTRHKAVLSSCFFNDRFVYNWPDFIFEDAANTFLDAEVGALVHPRPLYIELADEDEVFAIEHTPKEVERLRQYYAPAPEHLLVRTFHGTHEFATDEVGIEFLMGHL